MLLLSTLWKYNQMIEIWENNLQDTYKSTEEEARRKMEEMRVEKLREKGYDVQDEAAERARADRETAALRSPCFPHSPAISLFKKIILLCFYLASPPVSNLPLNLGQGRCRAFEHTGGDGEHDGCHKEQADHAKRYSGSDTSCSWAWHQDWRGGRKESGGECRGDPCRSRSWSSQGRWPDQRPELQPQRRGKVRGWRHRLPPVEL